MVLVSEGRTEVSPQYIEHVPAILDQKWVVHMVLGFDIPFDDFRQSSFAIEGSARSNADNEKTDGDNHQECRDDS